MLLGLNRISCEFDEDFYKKKRKELIELANYELSDEQYKVIDDSVGVAFATVGL